MNNIEVNGFIDTKLADGHFHLSHPGEIDRTVKIYEDMMKYFSMERISLNVLVRDSKGMSDPGANLKALYCKSVMNDNGRKNRVYVYGSITHSYDGKDS